MKKMKVCMLLLVVVLLAIPIFSIACTKETPSAPSTPTTPSTPSQPATPPAPKPVELSLASMMPPEAAPAKSIERFIEKVNKDSNGLITIRHFPANTLIPGPNMRSGVRDGVADMGHAFIFGGEPGFEVGVNLTQLVRGLNVPSSVKIFNDLWNKYPDIMASQWKDFKVLYMAPTHPTIFFICNKAVRKMDDLKGLEIRVPNAILADIVKSLGGTPVSMPTADFVNSLDKGTVDGGATTLGSMIDFQIADKFKYATFYAMGSSINFLIMNMESWNNLSPDMQKVLEEAGKWGGDDMTATWTETETATLEYSKEHGIEFFNLPADEYAKWDTAIQPVYDKMAADMNAAGYPGTDIVNFAAERSKFYSNQ
jgi:TRAP-type C4-dicarboxylate transport system substrate-binding protein